jgi:hypothetical protein
MLLMSMLGSAPVSAHIFPLVQVDLRDNLLSKRVESVKQYIISQRKINKDLISRVHIRTKFSMKRFRGQMQTKDPFIKRKLPVKKFSYFN